MADAADSKSAAGDSVRVQVPPSAASGAKQNYDCSGFALFLIKTVPSLNKLRLNHPALHPDIVL